MNNEELKNKALEFATDASCVYMIAVGVTSSVASAFILKQGKNGHNVFHDFNWANISHDANGTLLTNTEVGGLIGDVISTLLVLLIPAVLGAVLLASFTAYVKPPNEEKQATQSKEMEMETFTP
jgi:hypothetical protein